ncbi:MAG: hypothetical protein RR239_01480 [Oscillospiraceae bacterium]
MIILISMMVLILIGVVCYLLGGSDFASAWFGFATALGITYLIWFVRRKSSELSDLIEMDKSDEFLKEKMIEDNGTENHD